MNGWPALPGLGPVDVVWWASLAAVFLAALLALEGAALLWSQTRSPAVRRLRRRLQGWLPDLATGTDRAPGLRLSDPVLPTGPGAAPSTARWLDHAGARARLIRLAGLLERAGWHWTPLQWLALCGSLAALSGLALLSVAQASGAQPVVAGLLGLALGAGLPWLVLLMRARRRAARLDEQLPDALDLMARALRSGHASSAALQMVAEEGPLPLAAEFRRVHDQVGLGRGLDEALDDMAARWPATELRFFVVAVRLQRQTGGNLAELLDNLAGLMRSRQRLRTRVRVLSAEGRLSAQVLSVMPPATAAVIYLIRPELIATLWTDPAGIRLLQACLVMFAAGLLWMWKLTRLEV